MFSNISGLGEYFSKLIFVLKHWTNQKPENLALSLAKSDRLASCHIFKTKYDLKHLVVLYLVLFVPSRHSFTSVEWSLTKALYFGHLISNLALTCLSICLKSEYSPPRATEAQQMSEHQEFQTNPPHPNLEGDDKYPM